VTALPRVLIAEDHELFSQGLQAMLAGHCEVVGAVGDGAEVVASAKRLRPDVLLLDLSLPNRTGLDILRELRTVLPFVRVVVVTMHVDRVIVESALRAGAVGFVPKNAEVEELREAIEAAHAGRRYVSPSLPRMTWGEGGERMGFASLTARQQDIVRMVGRGLSTEQIAAELGLSEYTVHYHRKRIRQRLGLENDFEMLRYAILVGLSNGEAPGS
jgi:DNA-binding NarL/FixJ family response regulator